MKKGVTSTEFWVFIIMVAKALGLGEWITPETAQNTANQVVELANQLKGASEGGVAIYVLAFAFIVGRTGLKALDIYVKRPCAPPSQDT